MTAALTYTRRPLWLRLYCPIAIAWLRWEIDSAEVWIRQCARDGITTSEQLRYQRLYLEELRVRLAVWERA